MKEKRKSVAAAFPGPGTPQPEVSTLDLLAEVEAELVRLRAQNKRLTAKAEKVKKATAKRPGKKAGKKVAASRASTEPDAPVVPPEMPKPRPLPKRPALGRGLAQLFHSPGR